MSRDEKINKGYQRYVPAELDKSKKITILKHESGATKYRMGRVMVDESGKEGILGDDYKVTFDESYWEDIGTANGSSIVDKLAATRGVIRVIPTSTDNKKLMDSEARQTYLNRRTYAWSSSSSDDDQMITARSRNKRGSGIQDISGKNQQIRIECGQSEPEIFNSSFQTSNKAKHSYKPKTRVATKTQSRSLQQGGGTDPAVLASQGIKLAAMRNRISSVIQETKKHTGTKMRMNAPPQQHNRRNSYGDKNNYQLSDPRTLTSIIPVLPQKFYIPEYRENISTIWSYSSSLIRKFGALQGAYMMENAYPHDDDEAASNLAQQSQNITNYLTVVYPHLCTLVKSFDNEVSSRNLPPPNSPLTLVLHQDGHCMTVSNIQLSPSMLRSLLIKLHQLLVESNIANIYKDGTNPANILTDDIVQMFVHLDAVKTTSKIMDCIMEVSNFLANVSHSKQLLGGSMDSLFELNSSTNFEELLAKLRTADAYCHIGDIRTNRESDNPYHQDEGIMNCMKALRAYLQSMLSPWHIKSGVGALEKAKLSSYELCKYAKEHPSWLVNQNLLAGFAYLHKYINFRCVQQVDLGPLRRIESMKLTESHRSLLMELSAVLVLATMVDDESTLQMKDLSVVVTEFTDLLDSTIGRIHKACNNRNEVMSNFLTLTRKVKSELMNDITPIQELVESIPKVMTAVQRLYNRRLTLEVEDEAMFDCESDNFDDSVEKRDETVVDPPAPMDDNPATEIESIATEKKASSLLVIWLDILVSQLLNSDNPTSPVISSLIILLQANQYLSELQDKMQDAHIVEKLAETYLCVRGHVIGYGRRLEKDLFVNDAIEDEIEQFILFCDTKLEESYQQFNHKIYNLDALKKVKEDLVSEYLAELIHLHRASVFVQQLDSEDSLLSDIFMCDNAVDMSSLPYIDIERSLPSSFISLCSTFHDISTVLADINSKDEESHSEFPTLTKSPEKKVKEPPNYENLLNSAVTFDIVFDLLSKGGTRKTTLTASLRSAPSTRLYRLLLLLHNIDAVRFKASVMLTQRRREIYINRIAMVMSGEGSVQDTYVGKMKTLTTSREEKGLLTGINPVDLRAKPKRNRKRGRCKYAMGRDLDFLNATENKLVGRTVVLDASNIAIKHGNDEYFSSKGLQIAVDYFLKKECTKVIAILPEVLLNEETISRMYNVNMYDDRRSIDVPKSRYPDDYGILLKLRERNLLYTTPDYEYDDLYLIQTAQAEDAVIVSNDQYRDYLEKILVAGSDKKKKSNTRSKKDPTYIRARLWLKKHRLSFIFVGDTFVPYPDFVWPEKAGEEQQKEGKSRNRRRNRGHKDKGGGDRGGDRIEAEKIEADIGGDKEVDKGVDIGDEEGVDLNGVDLSDVGCNLDLMMDGGQSDYEKGKVESEPEVNSLASFTLRAEKDDELLLGSQRITDDDSSSSLLFRRPLGSYFIPANSEEQIYGSVPPPIELDSSRDEGGIIYTPKRGLFSTDSDGIRCDESNIFGDRSDCDDGDV